MHTRGNRTVSGLIYYVKPTSIEDNPFFRKSRQNLNELLRLDPTNGELLLVKSFVEHAELGNYQEASKILSSYLQHTPTEYHQAVLTFTSGKHQEALILCNQIIENEPTQIIHLHHRVIIYRFLGELEKAQADEQKLRLFETQLSTSDKKIICAIYFTLVTMETNKENGNLLAALIYCDYVIRLQPDNQYATHLRNQIINTSNANVLSYLSKDRNKIVRGDYAGAIEDLTSIIRLNPADNECLSTAFANRGLAKCLLGKYEDALKDVNHALNLNPNHTQTLRERAILYRIMGLNENAERDIQLTRQLFRGDLEKFLSKEYMTYATMEMKKEHANLKAALVYCEEALQYQSEDPNVKQCHAQILSMIAEQQSKFYISPEEEKRIIAKFRSRKQSNSNATKKMTALPILQPLMVAKPNSGSEPLTNSLKPHQSVNHEEKNTVEKEQLEKHNNDVSNVEIPIDLIEAVKTNNQAEFTKFLNNLKSGIYDKKIIDEVDKKQAGTALYWASAYGHVHFISPLIEAGATLNKPDNEGKTPVFIAAEMGHAEVITALKVAGATMNALDIYDRPPIWIAAAKGHAKVITALKAAGACMDTQTNDGATPVSVAAVMGHSEAIIALKAADANMHTPDNCGKTPVYHAAQYERVLAIKALVVSRANVNTPDLKGNTPLSIAIKMSTTLLYGNTAVDAITALLQAGADPSIVTPMGTPLELSQRIEDTKGQVIVRLLEEHLKQNPTPNKPCVRKHVEVKQEHKTIQKEDLEKLRLIFLEEREEGEKIGIYDLYNAYFKIAHPHAELIYKARQKIHVFYLNGKPLNDGNAVAEEISKMIVSFELETPLQPIPTSVPQSDSKKEAYGNTTALLLKKIHVKTESAAGELPTQPTSSINEDPVSVMDVEEKFINRVREAKRLEHEIYETQYQHKATYKV